MINWHQRFDRISGRPAGESSMGAEAEPAAKWWHVKSWGIGEWGSVASIIGVALWISDQRKRCIPVPHIRLKRR